MHDSVEMYCNINRNDWIIPSFNRTHRHKMLVLFIFIFRGHPGSFVTFLLTIKFYFSQWTIITLVHGESEAPNKKTVTILEPKKQIITKMAAKPYNDNNNVHIR